MKHRKQRFKVNTTSSSWVDLVYGVPYSSVLGRVPFNIFLNDLFFFLNDVQVYTLQMIQQPLLVAKILQK